MRLDARVELALLGVLWGISYLLIAIGLESFSPAVVVLVRSVMGTVVLVAAVLADAQARRDMRSYGSYLKYLPVQALVASTVPYLLISWGETRTSVATAGMLNAATPLFTFIFARIFIADERDSLSKVAGLVLGFAGVAMILEPWNSRPGAHSQLVGSLVVLSASAFYGYGFVYTRKYLGHRSGSPKVAALGQIALATVLAAPFVPFFHAPAKRGSLLVAWSAVLVLGVVQTGLATLMYHRVVRSLGATASSVVTYVIPVVAVVTGVLFAGDRLGASFIAGAAVVFGSVYLVMRQQGAMPVAETEATAS
ncbi:MAG: DMT family transporter [Actinomycetota bacterium]|nr:DMT family transporter [Actinomycetota bacterium]